MTSPWQHLIDKHRASLDAAKGIFTWTSEEELAWLAEEASKRNRILEIGTYKGHSALVLAEATNGCVVCFDRCSDAGVEEAARRNLAHHIKTGKVMLAHKDAGVSAIAWVDMFFKPFDMIWIDDGHSYSDVVRDSLISYLLRENKQSLICGHDYEKNNNDVARAVNDCFGQKNVKFGPGTIWYL